MSPSADPPVFTPLSDRALIRVAGPDWRSFLQGLLTQDVEGMGPEEVRYAALLTPQGRLLYDLFVWAEGEGAWLDVAADTRDALLARLKMYRLRAKVELEAASEEVCALLGEARSGLGQGWRRDPRLSAMGWRGIGSAPPEDSRPGGLGDYERRRIALGVADIGRDGLADRAYALEANLDLLNGVDFKKGCFVGQETTSRMKRRNGVRSRVAPLRFEGAAPARGAEVLAGELRAGEVYSGVDGWALALVRLDRAAAGGLTVDGRPVELAAPDWLAAEVG